jgi:hypothetical protein
VEDGRGGVTSDTVTVTVIDNVAPQIGIVSPTPNVLGPPNHQMVAVMPTPPVMRRSAP